MNRSTPGLPFHHQLLESTQTCVRQVGDAIQPSHPLLFPSPSALNLSQNQGLFQWVSSSHQVSKVLKLQLQHQSFHCIFRTISFTIDWFDLLAIQGTLKSLSSPTPQFKSISSSVLSLLYGPTLTFIHDSGNTMVFAIWTFVGKVMSLLFNMLPRFVIAFHSRTQPDTCPSPLGQLHLWDQTTRYLPLDQWPYITNQNNQRSWAKAPSPGQYFSLLPTAIQTSSNQHLQGWRSLYSFRMTTTTLCTKHLHYLI